MPELVTNYDQLRAMMEEMFMEVHKGFSEWEIYFLDKMYDERVSFSEKEIKKINEIYDAHM